MKFAIFSDIHGNYEALQAAWEAAQKSGVQGIYCLGDLVGYGPSAGECLSLIMKEGWPSVRGEFDELVLESPSFWAMKSVDVRESLKIAARELGEKERNYIENLPYVIREDSFSLVHGSLYQPRNFCSIQFPQDASLCFEQFQRSLCFFGHTHEGIVFFEDQKRIFSLHVKEIHLKEGWNILINPGSVGFPRDGDPRASFAMLDIVEKRVSIHRVEYDLDKTTEKIRKAGLPESLAERLKRGR